MSSPIFAVNADGSTEKEGWMLRPLRDYVRQLGEQRRFMIPPRPTHSAILACVTRARTASAVAHFHAQRLMEEGWAR